jgi:hypothetical protein
MKKATLLVVVIAALSMQSQGAAQSSDALAYARGFLLTGNYAVSSVDLPRSGGVGTLAFSTARGNAIPAGAEIAAAFLYWETIEPVENASYGGARFRQHPIDVAKATRLTSLPGTGAKCWGSSGGRSAFLTVYRADVLHLLPKHYDAQDKWTGRYLVNDADLAQHGLPAHTLTLPQQGTGNRTTASAGGSLVVVYRHPNEPLRKVVLYDGPAAQAQGTITTQALRGFYRSAAQPSARLTALVGTGADNRSDRLLFNGRLLATNAVPAPIDGGSDRGWASPTFDVSALMKFSTSSDSYGETATVRFDHGANAQASTPYECPSLAAVIFSTAVADVDADGLPDGIEDAPNGLKDPPTPAFPGGQPLPNLHAIGARVGVKDLLVEVNAMHAAPGTAYGAPGAPFNARHTTVVDGEGHDHMPSPGVLKLVGDAYAAGGVAVRFDVGDPDAYQAMFSCAANDTTCDARQYLVPAAHARGGERVLERACTGCAFQHFPGTVGWPYGFQLYRDAPVDADGGELIGFDALRQAAPEQGQLRRRFDRSRHDFFHYALYAHARGKARRDNANVPSSVSGVADLPGRNLLITLGLWDTERFIGTPFVQASTTLHELGHNLNLWHGGSPAAFGSRATSTSTFVEPNCKPNYLSSMSYQFQVHGLTDEFGIPRLDYSWSAESPLHEGSLSDGPLSRATRYRAAWFVPAASPLALEQEAPAARRYCNGAAFGAGAPLMARVEADAVDGLIDWDGDPATGTAVSDVNFDGDAAGALAGHDDWAALRLDQKQGRRSARIFTSAAGDLLDFGSGDLIDFGSGDLIDFGSGDLIDFGSGTHVVHLKTGDFFRYGAGDLIDFGSGDLIDFGSGDLIDFGSGVMMYVGANGDLLDFGSGDLLDFGSGDLIDFGSGDLIDFGSGDLLDFGSGDLIDFGSGDLLDFGSGTGVQELDFDAALAFARPRPFGLTACILGDSCPEPVVSPSEPGYHRVRLAWSAPTFGSVAQYEVSRRTAASEPAVIGTTTALSFIDPEELPHGVEFIYTVKALFTDGSASGASTRAAVTAINEPPVAAADAFTTPHGVALTIAAPGVLANDTQDPDSPAASRRLRQILSGPSHGTLAAQAGGGFTYTPAAGFAGTDTFTYVADNGVWPGDAVTVLSGPSNEVTVTITVQPAAVPACGDLTYTVVTGGSVTLTSPCADASGQLLAITSVSRTMLGTVTISGGTATYASISPRIGQDAFTAVVSNGTVSRTINITVQVVYGFRNVQNAPPASGALFDSGSTLPVQWQWLNVADQAVESSDAGVMINALACSAPGLAGAYPIGSFSPVQAGGEELFRFDFATNTWTFSWKLAYTIEGVLSNLPSGSYVLQITSLATGQLDPAGAGTIHSCANGTTVRGALVQVR